MVVVGSVGVIAVGAVNLPGVAGEVCHGACERVLQGRYQRRGDWLWRWNLVCVCIDRYIPPKDSKCMKQTVVVLAGYGSGIGSGIDIGIDNG